MSNFDKELESLRVEIHFKENGVPSIHAGLLTAEAKAKLSALLRRVERGASEKPKPGEQPSVSKSLTHSTFWHDIPNGATKVKMDIDWEGRLIMNVRFDTKGIDLLTTDRNASKDAADAPSPELEAEL